MLDNPLQLHFSKNALPFWLSFFHSNISLAVCGPQLTALSWERLSYGLLGVPSSRPDGTSPTPADVPKLCKTEHDIMSLFILSTKKNSRCKSWRRRALRQANTFSLRTVVAENLALNFFCWSVRLPKFLNGVNRHSLKGYATSPRTWVSGGTNFRETFC